MTTSLARRSASSTALGPHGVFWIKKGYVAEEVITRVLAVQLGARFVDLTEEGAELGAVRSIDRRLALRHECAPICATLDYILETRANPLDSRALDDEERVTNLKVSPLVATPLRVAYLEKNEYPGPAL